MRIGIDRLVLEHVGAINPRRRADGRIEETLFSNDPSRDNLHLYGSGPFCRFELPDIPQSYRGAKGVYVILCDDNPVYVGEGEDLAGRGYNLGHIVDSSAREGGQETFCRLNNLILEAAKEGRKLDLLFLATPDRSEVGSNLIARYDPEWNLTGGAKEKQGIGQQDDQEEKGDKYEPLARYLASSRNERELLSFVEIETIIGRQLPDSSRVYAQWWENGGGHVQANAWMEAGWEVRRIAPGRFVVFGRS